MRQTAPGRAGTQGPEARARDKNGQDKQRQVRAVNALRVQALTDSGKLIAGTDPETAGMAQLRHYHKQLRGAGNTVQAMALMEELALWYRAVLRNARARPRAEEAPEPKPPQLTPLSPEGETPEGEAPERGTDGPKKEGWRERAARWARRLAGRGGRE